MEITFRKRFGRGHILTFRTLSVIMWVFGVLRETLRTITQFITTMVVTDITNIKYLQSKVHKSHRFQHSFCWLEILERSHETYFPIRGTALEVSGTFLAMRNRNTVWPRRVAIDMVHFWPPATRLKPIFSQRGGVLCWGKQILMTYCNLGEPDLCLVNHMKVWRKSWWWDLGNPHSFPEIAHLITVVLLIQSMIFFPFSGIFCASIRPDLNEIDVTEVWLPEIRL